MDNSETNTSFALEEFEVEDVENLKSWLGQKYPEIAQLNSQNEDYKKMPFSQQQISVFKSELTAIIEEKRLVTKSKFTIREETSIIQSELTAVERLNAKLVFKCSHGNHIFLKDSLFYCERCKAQVGTNTPSHNLRDEKTIISQLKSNWRDDFHCDENRTAFEKIYNQEEIAVSEILTLFFKEENHTKIICYFREKINLWKKQIKRGMLNPFAALMSNSYKKKDPLDEKIKVKPLPAIQMLINDGFLPKNVLSLPKQDSRSLEEDTPLSITYHSLPPKEKDQMRHLILNNKVGAYIRVLEKYIASGEGEQFHSIDNTPGCFKRHKGFERLYVKGNQHDFDFQSLELKDNLPVFKENYFAQPLQVTNEESKNNQERFLISFNGKNEIQLADIVFLQEEMEEYKVSIRDFATNTLSKERVKKELEKFWENTVKKAKESGHNLCKDAIPCVKEDFINIIKKEIIFEGKHIFEKAPSTIADYLKKLGFKFKKGTRKGKPNIFREIYPQCFK